MWRIKKLLQRQKKKSFCIASSPVVKIGYTTITLSVEDRGVSPSCINIGGEVEYSLFEASALHLDIVYYELLKSTETIIGDHYRLQLMCLSLEEH